MRSVRRGAADSGRNHARGHGRERSPQAEEVPEALAGISPIESIRTRDRWKAQYVDLYENAPIGYLTLDAYGVVMDANAMSAKLLGLERWQLIGRPLARIVVDRDRAAFLRHMHRCRSSNAATTELSVRVPDGEWAVALDSRTNADVYDRPRYLTALIDRSERRSAQDAKEDADRQRHRAEERGRAAEASGEAKDRFLAELSHEMRTPLTPILAAVRTLEACDDIPVPLRRTIDIIQRNVKVEAKLIDDLLDVSRIAYGRLRLAPQPIDAHGLLREMATELAEETEKRGIRLVLHLNARDARLRADPVRLRQIVWNLVFNALDSTPRGGHVEVTCSNVAQDLRIVVRDDGVGIEQGELETIFTAFSGKDSSLRRRHGGLGLGLAIVKGLVEARGGRIAVFSAGKGRGASFVVEVPTYRPTRETPVQPAQAAPTRDEARAGGHKRILLVEDHADTRAALKVFLELKGYEVVLAQDVASALEAAGEPLDVVVCDIGLPDGSGFDVVRRISSEQPIKAIALSGYGSPRDFERSSEAGFAAHLVKPVGAEHLVRTIEAVCEGRRVG